MTHMDEANGIGAEVTVATRHSESAPRIQPDRIWLVMARRAYDEPLKQVGTVEADDPDLATVYARAIYDEFTWVEMIIVPRESVVTVIAS